MYKKIEIDIPLVKESSGQSITTPEQIFDMCRDLASFAQEAVHVITVDTKNRLIDRHLVSLGTLDSSIVHPRDIFTRCLKDNCKAFFMVHGHPSGDPTPSSSDIQSTKKIIEAGAIMSIPLLDHVIIGKDSFISLRESGRVNFDV